MDAERKAPAPSPAELVAALFRQAGYEVQQTVGPEPGSLEWFATPRSGFIRPRTYFRVLSGLPESVDAALAELESARVSAGADRAIAIMLGERGLPPDYVPDLLQKTSNLLTFRRWLLEVSGVGDSVRGLSNFVQTAPRQLHYIPRRARLDSGEEVALDPYLDMWTQSAPRPTLILSGPARSGKTTSLEQARGRAAGRFARDPEGVAPIVSYNVSPYGSVFHTLIRMGAVAPWPARVELLQQPPEWRCLLESHGEDLSPPVGSDVVRLELLPPSPDEVVLWMGERIRAEELDMFVRARRANDSFMALSNTVPNLTPMLHAVERVASDGQPQSVEQWTAAVVIAYARMLAGAVGPNAEALEDAALREFALQESGFAPWQVFEGEGWFGWASEAWFDLETNTFKNSLMRDYFLAQKVIREVQAGNAGLLLRYQLPAYVFLFIANLAPEVAARLTQSTVNELEGRLQEEVERKLHLTFAHLLNRPVGTIRAHLNEIREAIGDEKAAALARPFEKIQAEVDYVHSIAERIRLWQTRPDEPIELIPLLPLIQDVARPLAARHAAVELVVTVAPEVEVRGMREALREIVQFVLENAFQAAAAGDRERSSRVTVAARSIGAILRLEVRDNGCGVAPEDRARIFEPLVTTKKGGTGKLRGTGLGLSIARRWAEHMGGRVGLDAEQGETCFFVDLVSGRDEV